MVISFGSIIFCFGITLLFTIYLILIMKAKNTVFVKGNKSVFIGTIFILIRILIPFNFPFTITVPTTRVIPEITNFFLIDIGNYNIYTYFLLIWVVGAGIKISLLIMSHYKVHKFLGRLSDLRKNDVHTQFGEKIDKKIEILVAPINGSPVILGIFHPRILLPEFILDLPEKYVYDIIKHELQHFKNHDLWIVCLVRILVCLYWWNPFIYILRDKLMLMIELDSDMMILEEGDEEKKIDYAECLINISKNIASEEVNIFQKEGIALFQKKSILQLRIERIIAFEKKSGHKSKVLKKASSFFIAVFVFASLIFVPEAYNISGADPEETFDITPENAYLEEENGEYKLYFNGKYVITMEYIDEDFRDLPIYSELYNSGGN